ncbi:GNAT family N-acetyltransferase [Oceanisphaera sp. IT1-181]|uniref:GNAT family N-acetyltransferase n=1 Tax=Oceanisphaera sp. IT1-181 TaxID=3081199 RepID=UPI0029CA3268|nr:GNAT family N-acetyltransferase [Oceanisphaera sp. IT1-181]
MQPKHLAHNTHALVAKKRKYVMQYCLTNPDVATSAAHHYRLLRLNEPYDAPLAALIRQVSAEYGLTADKGYSVADPQLDKLSELYQTADFGYWLLVENDGTLVGGAGFAPVAGHAGVCELQKMYLLADVRGQGLGRWLAEKVLQEANLRGYQGCYLETTPLLPEALHLYQKLGFTPCPRLGNSGHDDCEITLMLKL